MGFSSLPGMPKLTFATFSRTPFAEGKSPPRKRRLLFSRFLVGGTILGASIGLTWLAIWIDWTKWIISRCQSQLPTLPPEEAIQVLHQLAPHTPASIPLLVEGLCDPRLEVAEAAKKQLQYLLQQAENQSWHQVCETLSVLADALASHAKNLPPHSWQTARQLAEWVLAWHPPEGSPERLQMIRACEKVLRDLEQLGRGFQGGAGLSFSQQKPPESGGSENPAGRKDLLNPLEGFRWPGGGLPVERLSGEEVRSLPSGGGQNLQVPDQQPHQRPLHTMPSGPSFGSGPILRIREPSELGDFPQGSGHNTSSTGGETLDSSKPRLNRSVRLSDLGGGEKWGAEIAAIGGQTPSASGPGQPSPLKQEDGQTGSSSHGSEHPSGNHYSDSLATPAWSNRASVLLDGNGSVAPEELREKDVRELLRLLGASAGPEQKVVQAELARRGLGQVSIPLAQQLSDPNPQVRLEVVRRLPSLLGVEPVAWLFWLCRDPDPEVRSAAITLLATTKDPAILHELERVLSEQPEEALRRQTERLRSIAQPLLR